MRSSALTPEWRKVWDERGRAVGQVLGETIPPNEVLPFSWKEVSLPGACGLTFGPSANRPHYTYMTLGLTQPIRAGDALPEWEFALKASELATWPHQILFDLLTYWLDQKPKIRRGLFLPLTFFQDSNDRLCAGLTEKTDRLSVVGDIRGLYLWGDSESLQFKVSSGDFGLLVAIAVTEDEIKMARRMTPPHLLLLLKRMQIGQISNPLRKSVTTLRGAGAQWDRVCAMSHDQAVGEL